ncbi:MAG: SDR family NAD(P)-dependent oxidoreductase, partial [Chloroflexota bacterium]|nr:SDR family NAD(P)-dependent oxidoreductase [Chloroflexota bacterium]
MSFPLDLFRLDGRVALITGGAGGLGLVFARALAGAGADIALLGRRAEATQTAADAVAQEFGHRALGVAADVTDQEQVRAAFNQVRTELGRIDILINSAGVNIRKPTVEFSLDDW